MTGTSAARPPLVLLVEDSEPDVVLTAEALEEARIAVELVVAKDGPAAIALLDEAAGGGRPVPELILLDLNLPKVHGLQVLEHVKSDPDLEMIPVIVMTSSKSPADRRSAYEGHAQGFVTKPLDPDEFLSIVRGIQDHWITIVRLPR